MPGATTLSFSRPSATPSWTPANFAVVNLLVFGWSWAVVGVRWSTVIT